MDRFNLQRYFTRRLWTGPNIYFALVITHSTQSGREMIIRKFSNSYSWSAMLWILTIIVVHVIHDSDSHSVIQLCSRNHDSAPRCLLRPWLYSRNGDWIPAMSRIPFPHLSSFVTINISRDIPIIIQTHLTQTETHERRSYHPITEQNRENQDVVDWDRELWCRDLGAIVINIFKSIDKTTNKSGCGGLWRQKIVTLWSSDNYDRKKCFQSSRYAIFREAVDQWKNNIHLIFMN